MMMKAHGFALRSLLGSLAAASLLSACFLDGVGHDDGQLPQAAISELKNRYQVVLTDAITDEPINDSLAVTFVGDAELKAADGSSLNGKTVTTTTGIVGLGATFTGTARDFSVQVADNSGKGWLATGTRVVGEAAAGDADTLVEIKLINRQRTAAVNASAKPIAMNVQTGSAGSNGALVAPVAANTAPKTVTNQEGQAETIGTARLELAAGTIGRRADGTPAAAGPVTVSSTYFANANEESLSAFPGGFSAPVEVPAGSSAVLNGVPPTEGIFITGGFAQFNVSDSSGQPIRTFDQPVRVGIDLPKSSRDEGGNPITVGSQYPIWSYNESTGKWVFEKLGVVAEKSPADPSNFTVTFETTHLSYWNLDIRGRTCTAQIDLTGRPAGDKRPLEVEIVGLPGLRTSKRGTITDDFLRLNRAPFTPVSITVRDGDRQVGRVNDARLCSGPVSVPLSLAVTPTNTVQVDTSESCQNGSRQRALPTFAVILRRGGPRFINFGYTTSTAGAMVASRQFTSVPAGSYSLYVFNPRAFRYEIKNFNHNANASTKLASNFPVTCPTGAGG